ncbi:hypothetical protein CO037_02670 [Candidatus Pacearchaeota archaeon CG_4_9_14_0_2_um_filter_30_8]|nr:MAG: hypothetical protein CO037_02670 [Candidatus Pacearchaeota archaeon CG_4_9_14_0_2_um_filter_30_8]
MNFIKKIKDKKIDGLVHNQFQKFSRGTFKNRAVIGARKTKNKYTINTSSEFANELVRVMAEKLGEKKTNVTGAIVSTSDLKEKIQFTEIKQFQGVKRYLINYELSGKEILNLLDEFPKVFFALTFNSDEENILKIKSKAPKSGKPGKGDEEPKADFCKLITNDEVIGKSFVFEKEDFKKADIKHEFVIEKIVMPETDEKDFAKIREMAKRAGKIVRYSEIDGVKSVNEYEFTA